LSVVLFGCETWSVTLREEHGLRVFENRVLRGIFGPERDEVTGDWRKLHNEQLHNLCCSRNIIRVIKLRRMGWVGHVACVGEEEKCIGCMVVWGKPEGRRPFGREVNINMRQIEWQGMGWIDVAQDRDKWQAFVNTVMNL
jgi:hypothetical protein